MSKVIEVFVAIYNVPPGLTSPAPSKNRRIVIGTYKDKTTANQEIARFLNKELIRLRFMPNILSTEVEKHYLEI